MWNDFGILGFNEMVSDVVVVRIRGPPRATRTDTRLPSTTLFRSDRRLRHLPFCRGKVRSGAFLALVVPRHGRPHLGFGATARRRYGSGGSLPSCPAASHAVPCPSLCRRCHRGRLDDCGRRRPRCAVAESCQKAPGGFLLCTLSPSFSHRWGTVTR